MTQRSSSPTETGGPPSASLADRGPVKAADVARAVPDEAYARWLQLPVEALRREPFRSLAAEARAWYAEHGEPRRVARRRRILWSDGRVLVAAAGEPVELESRSFALRLRNTRATALLVVAATAGERLDGRASELWSARPDAAWFLDRLGVTVVRHLVAAFERRAELVGPLTPGCGDGTLADLAVLHRILEEAGARSELPVRAQASGALHPRSSLLVAFGVCATGRRARERSAASHPTGCAPCRLDPCVYRRD